MTGLCNGILSGLVAITGTCHDVKPWVAFFIGTMGGINYVAACKIIKKLKVDDPIEASVVHGFGGMWGLIATGIFNESTGLIGRSKIGPHVSMAMRWEAFGWQIVGLLAIVAWTASISSAYFYTLGRYGKVRVDLIDEILGLDIAELGEPLPIFS